MKTRNSKSNRESESEQPRHEVHTVEKHKVKDSTTRQLETASRIHGKERECDEAAKSISTTENTKKKKRRGEPGSEDTRPSKRKNRKTNTDPPNPANDTSLTDQARRALAYVYMQFNDPPNWKFNKARQNWLVRNMWSDKAIPDIYMELLCRYLVNMKGGVRETLIKLCREASQPISQVTTSEIQGQELSNNDLRRTRAKAVLEVFERRSDTSNVLA